jgi:hypothetical protein
MHHEEAVIGLAGIGAVFGLPFIGMMVWLVLHYCFAAFRTLHETGLKREMVARGYTAEEIIAVVSAKRGCKRSGAPLPDVPPAKPIKQPAYSP